jgi:glycosyltransferase involved in cell wall biosynthesis
MRIVQLVLGGEVAGGQLVALRLAHVARERGHDVSFVVPSRGPFLALLEQDGFPAVVLPIGGALDVGAALRLCRLLRRERASILHTHAHFSVNVVGRVAGRLAGATVISHVHIENVFRSGGLARRLQIGLDNGTARLASRLVAVSEATRAAVIRQGYPADRTMTIRNGIEPVGEIRPVPLDVPEGARTLLEVGRLCDIKGQRELIRALARLEHDDAVLLLAGEDLEAGGAFRTELGREAAALGVADRVRFLGHRDDVPALIAAADLFVLPSWLEGLPLVALEAMAQGKPVVATAVGGTPELVVDGESGVLVPPRDVEALAAALDALLDDPSRASLLGTQARERVRREFSADAAAEQVLELYEQVGA